MRPIAAILMMLCLCSSEIMASEEFDADSIKKVRQQITALLEHPSIIESTRSQNDRNVGITEDEIIALDQAWRKETKSGTGEMIEKSLASPASRYLQQQISDAKGLFTEIIIMDEHGLNVAQSSVTSDYWQGDEAKWQKTYLIGPDAVDISDVEFDESSMTYQVQISVSLVDPGLQKVIGAATVGVDAELLD